MSRTMGDSSTFGDVPSIVAIVAAYINGKYGVPTASQFESKYPNSRYGHVLIDVNGSNPEADVRDWETGDKGGDLEQWVIAHNKSSGKSDAVIYCNRSTIPEVLQLTKSQILGTDYFLWVATLDGSVYQGHGVVACQNKGQSQTGGHWDSSIVFNDNFWQPVIIATAAATKPDCRQFQNAVRATPDNLWGVDTDKRSSAVISAFDGVFPYGITYAQQVVDTTADGIWGSASNAMLHETVISMQNALTAMKFSPGDTDGQWGPKTEAAYEAARAACHI